MVTHNKVEAIYSNIFLKPVDSPLFGQVMSKDEIVDYVREFNIKHVHIQSEKIVNLSEISNEVTFHKV